MTIRLPESAKSIDLFCCSYQHITGNAKLGDKEVKAFNLKISQYIQNLQISPPTPPPKPVRIDKWIQ